MNEAKRVLRWTVPGWIFFLMFYIFYIIAKFFSPCFEYLKIFDFNTIGLIPTLITLGVPLGFLISQIYYGLSRIFKHDIIKMFPSTFNSINKVLEKYTDKDKLLDELNINKKFKIKNTDHEFQFGVLYYFIRKIECKKNDNKEDKININIDREQELSNLSHSLGASNYAIGLSFIIYYIFIILKYRIFFGPSILINLIISASIMAIITINRNKIALNQIIILRSLINDFEKEEELKIKGE
jgi:hypothetical protein